MAEPVSSEPYKYKGVRDFYPDDFAWQEAMFARIRETLSAYGY